MARAKMTFADVKASKAPVDSVSADSAEKPAEGQRRERGRPPKHVPGEKIFGMTLRIPGELRKSLRQVADIETDRAGAVVSVHDVILQAIHADLKRRGAL